MEKIKEAKDILLNYVRRNDALKYMDNLMWL